MEQVELRIKQLEKMVDDIDRQVKERQVLISKSQEEIGNFVRQAIAYTGGIEELKRLSNKEE